MTFLNKRIKALYFACSGLWQALKRETNLRIQFVIGLLVIAAGFYFSISRSEWIVVSACIVFVISLELINSAIEKLCDLVMPDQHPAIKYIKDISAAAVLLACIFSAFAGVLIFWPHL